MYKIIISLREKRKFDNASTIEYLSETIECAINSYAIALENAIHNQHKKIDLINVQTGMKVFSTRIQTLSA